MRTLFYRFMSSGIRWLIPVAIFSGITWYGLTATHKLEQLPIEGRDPHTQYLLYPENADRTLRNDGFFCTLELLKGELRVSASSPGAFHGFDHDRKLLLAGNYLFRVVDNESLLLLGWRFPASQRRITAGLAMGRDLIFPLFTANRVFSLTRDGDKFEIAYAGNRSQVTVVESGTRTRRVGAKSPKTRLPLGSVIINGTVSLVLTRGREGETWLLLHPTFFARFPGVDGRRQLAALQVLRRLKRRNVIGNYNMQFRRFLPAKKFDFQYREAVQELIDLELLRFADGQLRLVTEGLDRRRRQALRVARSPVLFGERLGQWIRRTNWALRSKRPDLAQRYFRFDVDDDGDLTRLVGVSTDAVTRTREGRRGDKIAPTKVVTRSGHHALVGDGELILLEPTTRFLADWRDIGAEVQGVISGTADLGLRGNKLLRVPQGVAPKRVVTIRTGAQGATLSASDKGLVRLNQHELTPGETRPLRDGDLLLIGKKRLRYLGSGELLALSKSIDGVRRYHYPGGVAMSSLVGFQNRHPGLENLWGASLNRGELKTTIEPDIQRSVHWLVQRHMRWMSSAEFRAKFPQHRFRNRRKRHRIGVAVIDPRDGALVAAVSTPGFKPTIDGYIGARDEAQWRTLRRKVPLRVLEWLKPGFDESGVALSRLTTIPDSVRRVKRSLNRRLLNAALFERIPPGSTMKILVLAAYLEWMKRRGLSMAQIFDQTPRFRCEKRLSFAGHIFRCEGHHSHGIKTATNPLIFAMRKSCNIYFAKLLLYLSGVPRGELGEIGQKKQLVYLKRYKLMAEKIVLNQHNVDQMRRHLGSNRFFQLLRGLGFEYYYRDEQGRPIGSRMAPDHPLLADVSTEVRSIPHGRIFAPLHLTRKRLFKGRRLEYKSLYNLAIAAIGSDLDMTPMHLASLLLPVIRDGQVRAISIVEGGRAPERRVFSPEVARFIRQALRAVVVDGTGKLAFKEVGFTVIGKTGTSEQITFHAKGRELAKERFVRRHGPGALRANSLFVGATEGCRRDLILSVVIRNGARVLKQPDPMEAKYLAAKLLKMLAPSLGCQPDKP